MTNDITLRSPAEDELRDWIAPLIDAFYEDFGEGEFESERAMFEPARLVNAFDGDERIGSAGAFSLRLTVPGGEVAASGITAVGVRPDHRRRGVMRRMLDWVIQDARDRDEPVAVLWASEAAIYQRFGFGSGTLSSHFEVDRSRIVFRGPAVSRDGIRLRLVGPEEAFRLFLPIYESVRTSVPGSLSRPVVRWKNQLLPDAEWMRHGNGPKYLAVLEVDGQPRGYAIYRIKSDWEPRGPKSSLLVSELFGLDPEAEQVLWEWIFAMDLVSTVRGWRQPFPNPLQQWVVEPRRLGLTIGDGLWLRLLDVPAALEARTYAGEGTVVLEVHDPMFAGNAGRWEVAVRGGRASVTRTEAEADLALDVAALASTYLGAVRFGDLHRAGSVRVSNPDALQTADVLFTPFRAPSCNTMF
ncbi:MAG: GNAT family N-acetyltransferase [Chloroflexota bacterium]